jgi:YtkA-like protein
MSHDVAPMPPKVGPAKITVGLIDAAGKPIVGARVSLEGNMTHPGMRPVFGEAGELGSGRYQAPIQFTMGGDWIILVRINLPDGQKLEREFEVRGVQPG